MDKSKNFILIGVTLVLAWGFWQSENFMQLAAGVALFMFGMLALEQGFQAFTGGVLEKVLGAATRTRFRSLSFGLAATALMQSSSLVSLITISFLSAGLIGLASGIGIIFGSNIGTTTGAWLMASYGVKIDLASYAMPMAVFGILFIYQKDKTWKGLGHVLLGLALPDHAVHFVAQIPGQIRIGVGEVLVLTHQAAQLVGQGLVAFELLGIVELPLLEDDGLGRGGGRQHQEGDGGAKRAHSPPLSSRAMMGANSVSQMCWSMGPMCLCTILPPASTRNVSGKPYTPRSMPTRPSGS